MTSAQSSLFLSRLTYDIRFEIYSCMVLPPFAGHRDYDGLWRTCRQLYHEIDSVGLRHLQVHLRSIGNERAADSTENKTVGGHSIKQTKDLRDLELVAPNTVFGKPVLRLNALFKFPPQEEDWYRHPWVPSESEWGSRYYMERVHQGVATEYEIAAEERRRMRALHKESVARLLKPILQLHSLCMNMDIRLVIDRSAASRFSQDSTLFRKINKYNMMLSTVLGSLIDVYIGVVKSRIEWHSNQWWKDCTFRARAINIRWDFGAQNSPAQLPHDWHCLGFRSSYMFCRQWYTEDRQQGLVQIRIDLGECLQECVVDAKRVLRLEMARMRVDTRTMDDERFVITCESLAEDQKRLRKLGMKERTTSEPDEEEARILADLEERKTQLDLGYW